MLVLVLESSTSAAKAMLYSSELGMIDIKTESYLPQYSDMATQGRTGCFHADDQFGKSDLPGIQN